MWELWGRLLVGVRERRVGRRGGSMDGASAGRSRHASPEVVGGIVGAVECLGVSRGVDELIKL